MCDMFIKAFTLCFSTAKIYMLDVQHHVFKSMRFSFSLCAVSFLNVLFHIWHSKCLCQRVLVSILEFKLWFYAQTTDMNDQQTKSVCQFLLELLY